METDLEMMGSGVWKGWLRFVSEWKKLIADLFYYSRLGRGHETAETLNLHAVIDSIDSHLAETLMQKNARITVKPPLPDIVGHPAHISALFQNLISNGIKYSDAEEKVIEIGMKEMASDQAPDRVVLYVSDNGIGIDEQFHDKIFSIFKRLNSEKAYGEGTGAGLTFVKKIVENHQGDIWLTSALGEGTTFYFTLERAD